MSYIILTIIMTLLTVGSCAALWSAASKQKKHILQSIEKRKRELESKKEHKECIQKAIEDTIPATVLQERYVEMQVVDEALRAERGRITITEAEMETVEVRLRELEEIEREIEASSVETKEEIRILQKKHGELQKTMDALKPSLAECVAGLDAFLAGEHGAKDLEEKLLEIRTAMQATLEQGDRMLQEISTGNNQYFTMKSRYDALDIEYAQLYEKFSADSTPKEK